MKKSDLLKRNIETRERLSSEINDLKECQEEINSLQKRELVDQFEVEKRYNQVKQPLFEKRSQLMIQLNKSWASIFECYPKFSHSRDGDHESCLKYLKNFTLKDEPVSDPKSHTFTMYFYFNENPYFFNDVLWKKYTLDEANFEATTSSKIKWKANFEPRPPNESDQNCKCKKRKRILTINCGFLKWLRDNSSSSSCGAIIDFIYSEMWQNPCDFVKQFKKRCAQYNAKGHRKNFVGVDVDSDDELEIESYADSNASSFGGEFEDDDMSENGYDSNASRGSWDFDD